MSPKVVVLEGPATIHHLPGHIQINVFPTAALASLHAIDLIAEDLSTPVFLGHLPHCALAVAQAQHPPQPEGP